MNREFDITRCEGYEGCIYHENGVCTYDTAPIKVPFNMACNEPPQENVEDMEIQDG